EFVSVFELVEIAVVELRAFNRVVVAVRQRHPGGVIFLVVGEVEVRIGHQMDHEEFHRRAPSMNRASVLTNLSAHSACGRWPQRPKMSSREPGMRSRNAGP